MEAVAAASPVLDYEDRWVGGLSCRAGIKVTMTLAIGISVSRGRMALSRYI